MTLQPSTYRCKLVALVAMKQAIEYTRDLIYKLRTMGIPMEGPAFMYISNQSVLSKTTKPILVLKKKSNNAIAYHFICEGCVRLEWIRTYENTHETAADLFTKPLPAGEKWWKCIHRLLHHL